MIRRDCPHCGQSIELPASLIGGSVDCPACGQAFVVKRPAGAPVESGANSDQEEERYAWGVGFAVALFAAFGVGVPLMVELEPKDRAVARCVAALLVLGLAVLLCRDAWRRAAIIFGLALLVCCGSLGNIAGTVCGGFLAVIGALFLLFYKR